MTPVKLVSLLEILRSFAEGYVTGAHALALISSGIADDQRELRDVRANTVLIKRLAEHLSELYTHCEYLPMTARAIHRLLILLGTSGAMESWPDPTITLLSCIADVQSRLADELSLNLFFKLPVEKKKYFDTPLDGWEEVVGRFPEAIADIEEMSKCFALSRYAACVFHSVSAIEAGLEHLGKFIGVTDHQSGWTAVTRELDKITSTKFSERTVFVKEHWLFLEQMQAVSQALKSAWRNKISHAQNKLVLMTTTFSPDIATEIMMASRSFMRRLATEMPIMEKT